MTDIVSAIDNYFGITARGSDIKTEIKGGVITFLAMVYIRVVNPAILSSTGVDFNALFTATAVAAIVSCILTGIYAKFPVAMAPGMGINAFVAFTICGQMGFTYPQALMGVFISGLLFFLVSVTGYREKLLECIPQSFRYAITAAIGLFICVVGLNNAHIFTWTEGAGLAFPKTFPIEAGLGLFAIIITLIMFYKRYWFATIAGIILTSILGIAIGNIQLPTEVIAHPDFSLFGSMFTDFGSIGTALIPSFLIAILSLFIVDTFDSTGTLLAIGERSGMIEDGSFKERAGKTLLVDSGATMFGALCGTSTTTSFIESQTGIESGAKTGLMAVVVGLLFLLALFFNPIFGVITSSCVTGALVLVGILMIGSVKGIEWDDPVMAVTAFLTIVVMTFSSSISNGIGFGAIAYIIGLALTGRAKEINKGMLAIAILFAIYFPLYFVVIPAL